MIAGTWRIVCVWISVSDLEQLVERAVAAGADDERARVAHEHHLAGEEVLEVQRDVEVGVRLLLVRELDVAADRQRPGFARASVGRLHQARAAAGDDREAGVAERGAERARQLVVGVARAACAPSRTPSPRAPTCCERAEAGRELAGDVAHAVGVGGADLRRLVVEPQQQLLVERRVVRRCRPARCREPSRWSLWARPDAAQRRTLRGRWTPTLPDGRRARFPTRCGAPRAPAGCGSTSTPTTGVEVVLPARAPEREAAAAIVELRPVDRAAPGRGAARRSRTIAGRGADAPLPRRDARARRPSRAARARTGAASACWFPTATPGRRSSASTGARRGTRSRRGSIARAPRPGCATAASTSAASARAGRRARRAGG